MKGSMRKRGDSWELRVFVGRDPVTQRDRYVTRSVRGGKRLAQRELAALVAEVGSGASVATSASVNDLLDRWWATASGGWSASTRVQNESAMRSHIRPMLGAYKLAQLTAADVDRWYSELQEKPGRTGSNLSAATVVRVGGVLRSALGQAVKWGWIPTNPATGATLPKVRRPKVRPPDVEAIRRLLAEVRQADHAFYTYLLVAATTGARRSQICGLHWHHVDLVAARIVFETAIVHGDDGVAEQGTKSDKDYSVSLDGNTVGVLTAHQQNGERLAIEFGATLDPSSYVFSFEPDGSRPWRPDLISHRWARYRARCGLDGVRLHDVRHFMATEMLKSGVPVSVVAGRLGHSRASTTLNIYSHFVAGDDRAAAEALGGAIASGGAASDDSSPIHGQTMGIEGAE